MTAARHPFAVELRALLAIAAPLAAANVAQMLMGLTSTIMVGHLGSAALASAGLGGSLYFTLVIVCRSVLAAVAPLAAHAIGADEHHEAGLLAGTGLVMAGIIAMPIIVVLRLFGPLLGVIGYSPVLAAGVGEYLSAVCWGAPAFLAFEVLRALLAATSRARAVMLAVVLAIPANALLYCVSNRNSECLADRGVATRASREGPGESDDEASSHGRDRVWDVALGSDRRRLWVGNRREWQIAGAAQRKVVLRGEGRPVRRSRSRKRRCRVWRDVEGVRYLV